MKKFVGLTFALLAACTTVTTKSGLAERANPKDALSVGLVSSVSVVEHTPAPHTTYAWTLVGADGVVKDTWTSTNLVLTGGKNSLLDCFFKVTGCPAGSYLALKGSGTIAAADVWTSHAGWSEVTPYSGNRPTITWGASSAGSNTATQVSISINATATVAGACLSSINTGTTGILYSCTDFAAARSVVSGDTLQVTPTASF